MTWFWITLSTFWLAMLADCLLSGRLGSNLRVFWTLLLVFTGPIGMVAYVMFVWLDPHRGLLRRSNA